MYDDAIVYEVIINGRDEPYYNPKVFGSKKEAIQDAEFEKELNSESKVEVAKVILTPALFIKTESFDKVKDFLIKNHKKGDTLDLEDYSDAAEETVKNSEFAYIVVNESDSVSGKTETLQLHYYNDFVMIFDEEIVEREEII